jgi:undecaprenyl diphosphate synthase
MTSSSVPKSIGLILDGNRRWAKEHNLPQLEGHRRGMEKVKELLTWAREAGVQELIVYAFSTENWNRSKEEVNYLLDLFMEFCDRWSEEVVKQDTKLIFIGERERFTPLLQEQMKRAEEKTKNGTKGTLAVALSYGGRTEILSAVNALLAKGVSSVDERSFKEAMWSASLLDPDLIIRTGGEQRLSNFLTWQSTYSELFFTDTKLPALTKEEFLSILEEFSARERRHGR